MSSSGEDDHGAGLAQATGAVSSGPEKSRRQFSSISTAAKKAIGAIVALAAIAGGAATVYQVFFAGKTSPHPVYSSLDRSPVLGMQFRQNGSEAPMTSKSYGPTDVVTVSLLSQPFELLFPALPKNQAIGINVRYNSSGFDIKEGSLVKNNPSFLPGTGMATYKYGDGTLVVVADAQNYFIGTRAEQASDGRQEVYIASTGPRGTTPLTSEHNNLYLTVFRQTANPTVFSYGTYEYFILKFH